MAAKKPRRPLPELNTLVEQVERLAKGDRPGDTWVATVLQDIAAGIDVRERFTATRRGAPSDPRKPGLAMLVALRVADGWPVGEAQAATARKYRLPDRTVERAWKSLGKQSMRLVEAAPNRAVLERVALRDVKAKRKDQ
ncbi:MAG: hypothetical protein DYH20_04295 [Gammaproteobacteria bacterium PRO9]|nr:hypothetical protein [Gammaproteobacteria bacterium PRO9]